MNAPVRNPGEIPRIAESQCVHRRVERRRPRMTPEVRIELEQLVDRAALIIGECRQRFFRIKSFGGRFKAFVFRAVVTVSVRLC